LGTGVWNIIENRRRPPTEVIDGRTACVNIYRGRPAADVVSQIEKSFFVLVYRSKTPKIERRRRSPQW